MKVCYMATMVYLFNRKSMVCLINADTQLIALIFKFSVGFHSHAIHKNTFQAHCKKFKCQKKNVKTYIGHVGVSKTPSIKTGTGTMKEKLRILNQGTLKYMQGNKCHNEII